MFWSEFHNFLIMKKMFELKISWRQKTLIWVNYTSKRVLIWNIEVNFKRELEVKLWYILINQNTFKYIIKVKYRLHHAMKINGT